LVSGSSEPLSTLIATICPSETCSARYTRAAPRWAIGFEEAVSSREHLVEYVARRGAVVIGAEGSGADTR
jgi:hypothetical protein